VSKYGLLKKSIRVGRHRPINRCRQWTKVHHIFLFNAAAMVVDNAVYRLSISPSILEIFTLKVESCPKSRRILDIFRYPIF